MGVFGAADPKLQFFEVLGSAAAPAVRKLDPGGDVATISLERLELLGCTQIERLGCPHSTRAVCQRRHSTDERDVVLREGHGRAGQPAWSSHPAIKCRR